MDMRKLLRLVVGSILALCLGAGVVVLANAQTNISGAIAGTITDSTGAVVPNAKVTLVSDSTGQTKIVTSDAGGVYHLSFLAPGSYKMTVTFQGFVTVSKAVAASAGTTGIENIQLSIGSANAVVEVTVGGELIHTEDAQVSSTFDLEAIQALPNPGNDMTFYAQTTPGAVMAVSSGGGYGNFSTFGLPGTSNTFTINGGYNNDPFLNIGNTGATNLMLGGNDVGNVTVVSNAYDAAYGGLGGTQLSETTRSGSNRFHGNANYFWNGRVMNANDWFVKQSGSPRPFVNANQWGVGIGGPIWRDHTFFFGNYEGIRLVFPTSPTQVYAPSQTYAELCIDRKAPANAQRGRLQFRRSDVTSGQFPLRK